MVVFFFFLPGVEEVTAAVASLLGEGEWGAVY